MLPTLIPNSDLKLSDLPKPRADWREIVRFAMTLNGYIEAGSAEAVAQIANSRKSESLTDLRICLFFEYRRCNHSGVVPTGSSLEYIHSLIEKIRDRVSTGKL
jgi:hypothetical protein